MSKKFTWSAIEVALERSSFYAYYGDEELGFIEWYPKWKKWVWNQGGDIIMSESCLREVLAKITALTGESK